MDPVLNHAGLIRVELQTLFQRSFGQFVALEGFLQAAYMVQCCHDQGSVAIGLHKAR